MTSSSSSSSNNNPNASNMELTNESVADLIAKNLYDGNALLSTLEEWVTKQLRTGSYDV